MHRDTVVQLREWGTSHALVLPSPPAEPVTLGASPACTFQLRDPSGRLLHLHATLSNDAGHWILRDVASGTASALTAGVEIGIGGLSLIADSPHTIELREFLCRLLGWHTSQQRAVESALRSVRLWSARHVALVIDGEGDVVPIARALHDRASGAHQPFIVCDPRRRAGAVGSHVPTNHTNVTDAADAAVGGSLCVLGSRLPSSFTSLKPRISEPSTAVALVVCGALPPSLRDLANATIRIPPIATRAEELDRIIGAYAADAAIELGVPDSFTGADRDWVRARSGRSLAEIAKGTRRLVALRARGSVAQAAALLGMSHTSLGEWLGHRRIAARSCQTRQFVPSEREDTH